MIWAKTNVLAEVWVAWESEDTWLTSYHRLFCHGRFWLLRIRKGVMNRVSHINETELDFC